MVAKGTFRASAEAVTPVRQYRPLLIASLVIPMTGALLLILHSLQHEDALAVSMFGLLVALAALLVGGLLGFIFGIPRALQGNGSNDEQSPTYGVNTNLEHISDWLTKILVGVGLIELGAITRGLGELARTLSPGLGGPPSGALVAGAEIASFTTWGFLVGYLLTRTYLTAAFKDFDNLSPRAVTSVLEKLTESLSISEAAQPLENAPGRASYDEDVQPTENREAVRAALPLPLQEVTNLVTLRIQAVNLLAKLVAPTRAENPTEMIEILQKRGVFDPGSAERLQELLLLADMAVSGATLPATAEPVVKKLGSAVLRQLALRGGTAAALFEQHVLTFLQQNNPGGWQVRTDIPIAAKLDGTLYVGDARPEDQIVARADACVFAGDARVIVEVRSQISSGTRRQISSLRKFLDKTPADTPVVLVFPTAAPTRMNELIDHRSQQITVIAWDDDSDNLLPTVGRLLQAQRPRTSEAPTSSN